MGCCGNTIGNPNGSSLLPGDNDKNIQISNGSIVVNDGPNQIAKITLCGGMKIPYDQFVRTAITLPPYSTNIPLQYSGLLGGNITYLGIFATYQEIAKQPRYSINDPADNIIAYFFKTQPDIVRHLAQMMILTGTEKYPIPEVIVNNPSPVEVRLDIIAATTSTNIEDSVSSINNDLTIKNLKWTDILSDPISKDYIIYSNGAAIAYIDRSTIANIEVNGRILSIDDTAIGQIDMTFIDDWNANQANSILTWSMKDENNVIRTGMQSDTVGPVITFRDDFSTDIILNSNGTNSTNGFDDVITKQDLIDLWISSVDDNRDGSIILDDNNLVIIELTSGNEVNAITRIGKYDVTINVNDIAQNITKENFIINVKDEKAASIIIQTWVTNYVKLITQQPDIYLQDFTGEALNKQDLIDIVIDSIIDERDGEIPPNINNVIVLIMKDNITYDYIDTEGTYFIQYTVVDSDKNSSSLLWENLTTQLTDNLGNIVDNVILTIKENQEPVVIWKDDLGAPYEIDLYQFNSNGIISKTQLYKDLVIDLEDDRTPKSDIFLIDSKIIKTHDYDSITDSYIPITPVELFYIDQKGQYKFQVQHIDSDAKINTDQKTLKII